MSPVLKMFGRRQPRQRRRGAYLLPSLFTVANMFCGWACIVFTLRGDYVTAAPFIGFAMVLDLIDGRIARATGSTSEFGTQLDSLADVISFGVAPATLVFAWGLEPLGRLGWAVAFLWLAATAVRLARFNIQGHEGARRYFIGLPSPAAAGVPASTVFAWPLGFGDPSTAIVALSIVLVPAVLMVNRLRFRSFGALIPGRRRSYLTPVVIAAVIAAIAAQPEAVLLVMAYSYLLSGIIGAIWRRTRRRRHDDAASGTSSDRQHRPA